VYEYDKGIKMSFTQNVFHPRSMPNGNQYVYVYGSKGAVDLMAGPAMLYLNDRAAQPKPMVEKAPDNQHAHIVKFYAAIRSSGPNPADITIGAAAALTAIIGHEAMAKEKVVKWDDLGVRI
jgi:myo-inositol 2-dehydrogenase/D-chiro-inositol 1-dehydrogenase